MVPDNVTPNDKAVTKMDRNTTPEDLPILPLDDQVAFPKLNMSLAVPLRSSSLIEAAMKSNHLIGIAGTKEKTDEAPLPSKVHETGYI
jgi:ATP-dependent Lon protease